MPGIIGGAVGGLIGPATYWYFTAPLWHYSTAGGFSGITTSGAINAGTDGLIWATNIPPSVMFNSIYGPVARLFIGWVGRYQVGTSIVLMPLTSYFSVNASQFTPSLLKLFQFYTSNPVYVP